MPVASIRRTCVTARVVLSSYSQRPKGLYTHKKDFSVSQHLRSVLILTLAALVAVAYSPATFADKKGNSNSSSSDDKKDKDKDKDKDDQNNQRRGRDRQKSDDKPSNAVQQLQNSQQGGSNKQSNSDNQQNKSDKQKNSADKQNNSKNTQPVIIGNSPQNGQIQKSQQQPFIQKQQGQNNQKQFNQQPNFQQQGNKDKWQNQRHKDHKELNKWVDNFGGPKPFSSKWYKDHPKAWHHKHHDHDDAWKVATAAGIVGFLGWEAYHSRGPVVVYQPVPYDTLFVSRPGVIIDPNRGDWMPLGVYSLMVGPGDENTRMLDLVVDRFGHVRGSYYDMISGASYNIAGIIDQRSQYAQFSLESNRQLTFYTPIGEMLQPQGYINVQLPSGQRQQWQLVRMESTD